MNVVTILKCIFPIVSVLFVLIYLMGLLNLHFSDRNNYCAMTYMFEYPQFVRLSVPENDQFPGYGLYAYSEGRFTERARKMWFDGVPVLYLPGNSGSHMQARSLASVALRMAISRDTNFHFDYFTISFNEEVSGLYGGVLEKQTMFASASIDTILSLYRENRYRKSVPNSVILIGHSMGGVIAKRLLAHQDSINKTNIAIALAAPLVAPVVNFDESMNDFYTTINSEWESKIRNKTEVNENKMLLSFGGGPRDVLVPSGLTSDEDSYISALTTAIPGVWVSPDHVGIVWCKQLVMVINKFLFSIVAPATEQVHQNMDLVKREARMYFKINRSIAVNPDQKYPKYTMTPDAFWYEDNRRIYQISRPEIDKLTYLMIRLVKFPQNRFAAIEAVNVSDKDWIFGCQANDVYNTHRYCNSASSLSPTSRWIGAATNFGKRKVAIIQLHTLSTLCPEWTHVIVKLSPTRKPVTLNVDVNDLASRVIKTDMPSSFSIGKTILKDQTEPESVYYEIILNDFTCVQQAFYLYIEPTPECKAPQYHVTAELHVPWAKNHEYYHYFTHEKKSPMKLRLFSSKPKYSDDDPAKVSIFLDPQCTFSISISMAWYHRLAQTVRHYTPVLIPYMGGILVLALRNTLINIKNNGVALPVHKALISRMLFPYFCVPAISVLSMIAKKLEPYVPFIITAGWNNREISESLIDSMSMLFIYMAALGILYISAAIIQALLMFSSQVTHRFFFRIVWSGTANFAERVASGLQKVPLVVSFTLMIGAPFSCGAASLAAGAAFYAFMLSKMYEEYFEDYVYNIVVKYALRMCRALVRSKGPRPCDNTTDETATGNVPSSGDNPTSDVTTTESNETNTGTPLDSEPSTSTQNEAAVDGKSGDGNPTQNPKCDTKITTNKDRELEDQLSSLNFHVLLFLMWLLATIVNLPALMTWARSYNEDPILRVDTSLLQGIVMSGSTVYLFQMRSPKRNLHSYNLMLKSTFFMAGIVFALGSTALYVVGEVITIIFLMIASQQMMCTPDETNEIENQETESDDRKSNVEEADTLPVETTPAQASNPESSTAFQSTSTSTETSSVDVSKPGPSSSNSQPAQDPSQHTECDEDSILHKIKVLKEKLSFLDHT